MGLCGVCGSDQCYGECWKHRDPTQAPAVDPRDAELTRLRAEIALKDARWDGLKTWIETTTGAQWRHAKKAVPLKMAELERLAAAEGE